MCLRMMCEADGNRDGDGDGGDGDGDGDGIHHKFALNFSTASTEYCHKSAATSLSLAIATGFALLQSAKYSVVSSWGWCLVSSS